jgi:large subunit ribosomal protein L21
VYAIIETGGKQYKVSGGDVIYAEKLNAAEGETIVIDKVLVFSDGENLVVGAPYTGYKCEATVVKHGKNKKIHIIRYKAKKNEKKHIGHRQPYTKLQIMSISK